MFFKSGVAIEFILLQLFILLGDYIMLADSFTFHYISLSCFRVAHKYKEGAAEIS